MKSAFEVSLVACLLAVAAGCSAGDGSTDRPTDPSSTTPASAEIPAMPTAGLNPEAGADAPVSDDTSAELTRSRRPRPRPPSNPCAAVSCLTNTSCDVVDGQAVCVPIDPAPSGRFCGGFAGIACPGSGNCVDDPSDSCDPERGGADCGGLCACVERVLCIRGLVFDPSPDVCACVPAPNPCAAALCPAPSTCDVVNGEAVCTPIAPKAPFCGGIAGIACPGSGSCVDDPADDCDPTRGGADCGGICECNIRALCIQGLVFDPSPEVCACVPSDGGSGQECSADAH